TEDNAFKIGRVTTGGTFTEYPTHSYPSGLAVGPDHNLWFTEDFANKVAKVGTAPIATQLVFSVQPGNGVAGSPLLTQPVVTIQDGAGHRMAAAPSQIALYISPGTATTGAPLACAPVNAIAGVATFANCGINLAGNGYKLTAADVTDGV